MLFWRFSVQDLVASSHKAGDTPCWIMKSISADRCFKSYMRSNGHWRLQLGATTIRSILYIWIAMTTTMPRMVVSLVHARSLCIFCFNLLRLQLCPVCILGATHKCTRHALIYVMQCARADAHSGTHTLVFQKRQKNVLSFVACRRKPVVIVVVVDLTSRESGSLSDGVQSKTLNPRALGKVGGDTWERETENVRQTGSREGMWHMSFLIFYLSVVKTGDLLRAWRKLHPPPVSRGSNKNEQILMIQTKISF